LWWRVAHVRHLAWLSAAELESLVDVTACADALEAALQGQSNQDVLRSDPDRSALNLGNGQLLLMPSASTGRIGVKLVTVAGAATRVESPRIQGVHVQFDAHTLAPKAILDGIALTNLRTAALSVLALRYLADPSSTELLVFGAGPQALSHVRGIVAEWPIHRITVATRTRETAMRFADTLAVQMRSVEISTVGPEHLDDAVAAAGIIVCATTARTPLFVGPPRDGAAIVAVGSHSPHERELPGSLIRRAYVVVEDRATALTEAGDIVLAISDGDLTSGGIDADIGELVRGAGTGSSRPRVFKSVGMAWQDAVVADAVLSRV
jgi:ornithine cyclodeaminase